MKVLRSTDEQNEQCERERVAAVRQGIARSCRFACARAHAGTALRPSGNRRGGACAQCTALQPEAAVKLAMAGAGTEVRAGAMAGAGTKAAGRLAARVAAARVMAVRAAAGAARARAKRAYIFCKKDHASFRIAATGPRDDLRQQKGE